MKFFHRTLLGTSSLMAALSIATPAMAGKTLDAVKTRGVVNCGVHTGSAGFGIADGSGQWSGLDVDLCRAVAAAALGDATKVKFIPTSGQTRITALQGGEVDLLARNTTWTLSRDTSLGLTWVGVNFYDGQGFLARKKPGLKSAKDLAGATVCTESSSTSEKNLTEFFRAKKINFKPVVFDNPQASIQALNNGRCQVYSTDASALGIMRVTVLKNPEDYVMLPERISKEPLGPAVRRGDEEWASIVKWSLYAMINAEEMGVTQANVDAMRQNATGDTGRLLGVGDDMGKAMGLDKDWSYRIVKQVGNYGESYERNLGARSKINIPRGINNLWTNGGLVYAPPMH